MEIQDPSSSNISHFTAVTSPEPGDPADGGGLLVHQGHAVDEEDRLAAPGQLRPRLPDEHGGDVGLAAPRAQVHDRVAAPSLLQQLVLMIDKYIRFNLNFAWDSDKCHLFY